MLETFLDQERRAKLETAFKHKSADELEKTDPALNAYYQARLPEALKLLGTKRLAVLLARIAVQTLRLRLKRRK
jgi:hypothetical protein